MNGEIACLYGVSGEKCFAAKRFLENVMKSAETAGTFASSMAETACIGVRVVGEYRVYRESLLQHEDGHA